MVRSQNRSTSNPLTEICFFGTKTQTEKAGESRHDEEQDVSDECVNSQNKKRKGNPSETSGEKYIYECLLKYRVVKLFIYIMYCYKTVLELFFVGGPVLATYKFPRANSSWWQYYKPKSSYNYSIIIIIKTLTNISIQINKSQHCWTSYLNFKLKCKTLTTWACKLLLFFLQLKFIILLSPSSKDDFFFLNWYNFFYLFDCARHK